MGEASAFGLACRARGELNIDGIVKLQLRTQGLNTCHVFGPRQCADIGKIDIFDMSSYVAVSKSALRQAMNYLADGKVKGRAIRARKIR